MNVYPPIYNINFGKNGLINNNNKAKQMFKETF